MKKVLFATTALVASAGVAAAEMSISGYFEAGIVGGDGGYAGGETQFLQQVGVKFSGSGTTDSGLSFGATIELDDISNINAAGTPGAGRLDSETAFISGSWGKLSIGDQDGAYDWAMQEVGYGTAIADDHTSHAGYNGNGGFDASNDNQVLRYSNSVGDFGFAASLELDDTGAADDVVGVGVTYDMALGGVDVGLGLGYQDDGTSDILGISVDLAFAGGFGLRLNHSDWDADDHMGVGVSYSSGNLLVAANYGEYDTGADGYGVVVNYDLGGGAVAMFGFADDSNDADRWSLGLGMSF